MIQSSVETPDWSRIPAPSVDGAAAHLGVAHLFGLSTQDTAYQRRPSSVCICLFRILSDEHLQLTAALRVPTFEVEGMTLLKRFTLVVDKGRITKVFYPVFPPDRNAGEVVAWLEEERKIAG
jgi:peroxiredoxin (alkyl hydroperoxide reductase subunit C)